MSETNGAAVLEIVDLHAEVEGKEILKGIDLTVRQGETHALMGPNGSGKSTLSNVIMGRPGYKVTQGKVVFKGEDITRLTPDERAKRGLFLAMQYPTEVPGVSVVNFLRTAYHVGEGRADQRPGVPKAHEGEDGHARCGGLHGSALCEPRILRWREEEERGPAARRPGATDRHP